MIARAPPSARTVTSACKETKVVGALPKKTTRASEDLRVGAQLVAAQERTQFSSILSRPLLFAFDVLIDVVK
jgi:hypothetical protein